MSDKPATRKHPIRDGHIRGFARHTRFGNIARFSSHPRLVQLVRAELIRYGQRIVDCMAEKRREDHSRRIAFEVEDVDAAVGFVSCGV